jgi:hypothetical protein
MRVFDREWTNIDESFILELQSLEREGAIYVDHWQDHLNDFRHVRIKFTPDEIEEYVRSIWSFELFLQTDSAQWAREVPGIPTDIAARADNYALKTADGKRIGPPCHCLAAFLGDELEALVCSNMRTEILEEFGTSGLLTTIKRAIDSLTPSIRLFNQREKGLVSWPVTREDDVRDLLYAVLRAAISDIRREEAVPSRIGMHKVVDLCSKVARLFIEVKWISRSGTWKQIVKQINDASCGIIIFVVIDAAKDIPDPALFEKTLAVGRL